MKFRSWLWPDRCIGKRESRMLRQEHNELVNRHHDLLLAIKMLYDSHSAKDTEAIAKAEASDKTA